MIIGRLLRPLRSGPGKIAGNDRRIAAPTTLEISSPEFAERATMPAAYRGKDSISPPLRWSNVPAAARELVLIAEDVDVPFPQPLVHTIVYGIPVERTSLEAGAIPSVKPGGPATVAGLKLGKAAGFAPGYLPVTPIPGHGPHRYVYQLFALDVALPAFAKPPSKKRLLAAMAGHVIARGATIGLAEA
jgi:Raf kinase inhibitor-like YbhB/YbcL family protein